MTRSKVFIWVVMPSLADEPLWFLSKNNSPRGLEAGNIILVINAAVRVVRAAVQPDDQLESSACVGKF